MGSNELGDHLVGAAAAEFALVLEELAGVGWSLDATDDTSPDAEGQALASSVIEASGPVLGTGR